MYYDVISTCDDSIKWSMRSDVDYTIEVFYIQNFVKTLQEIVALFRIDMKTMMTNINTNKNNNNQHVEISSL